MNIFIISLAATKKKISLGTTVHYNSFNKSEEVYTKANNQSY